MPFILLTEHADEKAVAEIIQAGAYDCMDRSQLDGANLVRTIRCAISLHSNQQQRQLAEESLRKLSCAVGQSGDVKQRQRRVVGHGGAGVGEMRERAALAVGLEPHDQ